MSWIKYVIIIVVAVIVGFIIGVYSFQKFTMPRLPESKRPPGNGEEQIDLEVVEMDDVPDLRYYVPFSIEDITANPGETRGQSSLTVSVVLFVPQDIRRSYLALEYEVRAIVIERIIRKRLDELDDLSDHVILLLEIKEEINATIRMCYNRIYPDFQIPRILFTKYTLNCPPQPNFSVQQLE